MEICSMSATFSIIGSGPAGMYAADALMKNVPNCKVDIFEKYPAPYGLIRYGVAPDHYNTRNTSRQFARTLEQDAIGYYGNVEIGKDISMDELKEHYDAVIIALGSYNDRKLGIDGEKLKGVYEKNYGSSSIENHKNPPYCDGCGKNCDEEKNIHHHEEILHL